MNSIPILLPLLIVLSIILAIGGISPAGSLLEAQTSPASPAPMRPYQGAIHEDDLRVAGVRELLGMEKALPPEGIRLRYAGARGDYLEFHDLVGESIYYRYRRDRFDRLSERKRRPLIRGQAYAVAGSFEGLLYQGIFYPKREERRPGPFSRLLPNKNALLVFSYLSARRLLIEQLLL